MLLGSVSAGRSRWPAAPFVSGQPAGRRRAAAASPVMIYLPDMQQIAFIPLQFNCRLPGLHIYKAGGADFRCRLSRVLVDM